MTARRAQPRGTGAAATQKRRIATQEGRETPQRAENVSVGPRNKFGAIPTTVDGIRFASKAESRRYMALSVMARHGLIRDLECQPKFPLVVNGVKVGFYLADFGYVVVETGERVVEDVKSKPTMTPVYRLKKKLVRALFGIEIREVA